MPGEGAARSRFLKGDGRCRHSVAQHVAALAGLKVDDALLEMRVPVISRPYPYAPDHGPLLFSRLPLLCATLAAAECGPVGRHGTTVARSRMAYKAPPRLLAEQLPVVAGRLYPAP